MTARLKASLEEERNAERGKNELIASVSHDLRTPLTSILGYLELMDRDPAPSPADLRRYAEVALNKSRQLQKLIDRLFEYTKVSGGGTEDPSDSRIDLKALLGQLAEEFVPTLAAEGMEYQSDRPRGALRRPRRTATCSSASSRILLSNAVRYGRRGTDREADPVPGRGWTIVDVVNYSAIPSRPRRCPTSSIASSASGRTLTMEAAPPQSAKLRAFPTVPGGKIGGAGLGLAIAKSIVDLHAGEITARSDDTRTVFRVKLRNEHAV